jgi:glycosyltransferase involved in cell wall biosynthesis
MPTYNQALFLPRAIQSLLDQTVSDWELVVVDDGSTDGTEQVLQGYRDERIVSCRSDRNQGLGAALTRALELARGRYIAYLPSDDYLDPAHLAHGLALLDHTPDCYAAYGGVRWWHTTEASKPFQVRVEMPTLKGAEVVGEEEVFFARTEDDAVPSDDLRNGNLLALVQVMHRRTLEDEVRWPTRAEYESDMLEIDYWRSLAARGATFRYTGEISCEWGDHPDQRHKIIGGRGYIHPTEPTGRGFGLARYRQHYGIRPGERINWRTSFWSLPHDQNARYGPLDANYSAHGEPGDRPLRILVAGELGFNPERLLALSERGHTLYGTWVPNPQGWQTVGPLPFEGVTDVAFDEHWKERVKEIAPDFIYALLNWQALPLIRDILAAQLDIPIIFHFKESPFLAMEMGLWPTLVTALKRSAGVILINDESREFLEIHTGVDLSDDRVLILDGDLPKGNWFTEDWSPKLSEQDNEIHTVCVGRIRVESRSFLEPMPVLAAAGIHVHVYGETYQKWSRDWLETGTGSRFLHLHPTVEPKDWTRELSQYDAAWPHVHQSANRGDLRRAHWDDLNFPGRLGTYAVGGLPLVVAENAGHRVAIRDFAEKLGIAVAFEGVPDLAAKLRDRSHLAAVTGNARTARASFNFDEQVPRLLEFCRRAAGIGSTDT